MRSIYSNDSSHYEPDKEFGSFAKRKIALFDDEGDAIGQVDLLLPIAPATDEALQQRKDRSILLRQAHEDAKATKEAIEELTSRYVPPAVSASGLKKSTPAKLDQQAQREELLDKYAADEMRLESDQSVSELRIEVYPYDEPLKLLNPGTSPDRDMRERSEAVFQTLKKLGNFRRLASGGSKLDSISEALKVLRTQQPHFSDVLAMIENQIALAKVRNTPLALPPILLLGDPGVGKTHFTQELARVLNRPMCRHGFDSSHTASSLMGSARHWGNTHMGIVFEMVCLGEQADPVILLDEIDKASDNHYQSPLAPLHSLLEPVTSKKVVDISVGLEFDASHVLWIATANDGHAIPAPVRSRFLEFIVQAPTGAQALQLARNVAHSLHDGMKLADFEPPAERIVVLLAHLTPREQIQSLKQAYASAIANGRKSLHVHDLPADVFIDNDDDSSATPNLFH
jgi:ATP-dependent Lon protease